MGDFKNNKYYPINIINSKPPGDTKLQPKHHFFENVKEATINVKLENGKIETIKFSDLKYLNITGSKVIQKQFGDFT